LALNWKFFHDLQIGSEQYLSHTYAKPAPAMPDYLTRDASSPLVWIRFENTVARRNKKNSILIGR